MLGILDYLCCCLRVTAIGSKITASSIKLGQLTRLLFPVPVFRIRSFPDRGHRRLGGHHRHFTDQVADRVQLGEVPRCLACRSVKLEGYR